MTMQRTHLKQFAEKWNPHSYQKKAVKFLLEHASGALFLDPGLGKTSITLAAIKMLKKKKLLGKVLLIAPLRVCHSVWPAEVKKWKDFENLKVVVLHGKGKDEKLKEDADIYVINPEGLDWLLGTTKTKSTSGRVKVGIDKSRWKSLGFDTLVLDELTKFKNPSTSRFKAMKLIISTFHRRWGLTGSPAANGLEGLFGQCYMLDEGRSLGKYITQFRDTYFDTGYDGYSRTPKKGAEKAIYERIKPLTLRMGGDLIDMPKLVENKISVLLPDKAMNVYENIEKDLFACLDDGSVTVGTAASASIKCRQVASGGIYLDPEVEALTKLPVAKGKEWSNLHNAKVDALESLVEELQGAPLLVAYNFLHDLDRLYDRFGEVPTIGGGVSIKKSTEIEEAWNRGELPLLFGHPQSIGHGLNLQACGHHICWHTPTWDYELYDQFNRRIYRQGNTNKRVFVHHLITEGTIDEDILWALKQKKNGQNNLFKALQLRRSR